MAPAAALPTYAMTESMPIASARCPRAGPRGVGELKSVGFAAGPSLAVVAADGRRCPPPGTSGEVCVAGDCVTSGYELRAWQPADPNRKAFVGGDAGHRSWLRTGDRGVLEPDGFGGTRLRLVGRSKEIINRGGEKISPLAIEDALLRHPAVKEVACFAAPDDTLGEVVGALVVLAPGRYASPAMLVDWCASGVGPALSVDLKWAPRLVVYAANVPKGPTGKPLRIKLAEKLGLTSLDAPSASAPAAAFDLGDGPFEDASPRRVAASTDDGAPDDKDPVSAATAGFDSLSFVRTRRRGGSPTADAMQGHLYFFAMFGIVCKHNLPPAWWLGPSPNRPFAAMSYLMDIIDPTPLGLAMFFIVAGVNDRRRDASLDRAVGPLLRIWGGMLVLDVASELLYGGLHALAGVCVAKNAEGACYDLATMKMVGVSRAVK